MSADLREPDDIVLPNTMNPTTSAEAAASMDLAVVERKKLAEANKRWGGGEEFSRGRVTSETLYWLGQASAALAEAARRVAWAHDVLGPDDWKAWVATDLGISSRSAYNLLGLAKRLLADGKDHSRVLALGPSKVYELLSHFDDKELEVLEDGGSVEDLDLDRFDDMSVREMKRSLRKLKEHKDGYLRRAQEAEKERDEIKEQLKEERYGKVVPSEQPAKLQERWRNADLALRGLFAFLNNDLELAGASPAMFNRALAITTQIGQWQREFDALMASATFNRVRGYAAPTVTIDGKVVKLSENALSFCATVWISLPGVLPGKELELDRVWRDGWTLEDRQAAADELLRLGGLLPLQGREGVFLWNVRDPHNRLAHTVEQYYREKDSDDLSPDREAALEAEIQAAQRSIGREVEVEVEDAPTPKPRHLHIADEE